MEGSASLSASPTVPPSALLVEEIASLGLAVLVVASRDPGRAPYWLVVDAGGKVLEQVQSHLLALAKLQIHALNRFAASVATAAA